MRYINRLYVIVIFCALSSSLFSQEDGSAWNIMLDSINVKGYRYYSPLKLKTEGVTLFDMGSLSLLPQIMGNADPIHYAQLLPSIQTNSEYRSGINIEGCDSQHNAILIEGVPIYNVNHLLGFFSTFNSSHYQSMSITKSLVSSASPNRLGGQLEMLHTMETSDSLSGIISVGLISSQGTIRLPLNAKTTFIASLRGSYINLFYSKWLNASGQQVKYSFYDTNISLVHLLNDRNSLLIDFYHGNDHASFSEGHYLADMKAKWGNSMGAIHWIYDNGKLSSKVTAYISSYRNRFSLSMQDMFFKLPSSITDFGIKNDVVWRNLNVGIEAIFHDIHPQSLEHEGQFNITDGYTPPMRSLETSIYSNYNFLFAKFFRLLGGLRGSILNKRGVTYGAIDPSIRMIFDNKTMHLSATYAIRHQYLFQTGFTDSGLPTEFWISANENFSPQYAHELSVFGSSYVFNQRYRISIDLFYRKLYHQLGYMGSVLDYINSVYDMTNSLIKGIGENYGFSVMLSKNAGRLTGWLSYTYTHARRHFEERSRSHSYPASHERPHEFKGVTMYSLNRHWSFSGTFVYASGTPFTFAQSIFLLNNNIVVKYGDYNASRLHPYFRCDLSVNYKWGKNSDKGINISLYNISNRDNELFYYLSTHEDGSFAYRPVSFIIHTLPSISYYCKF